ncbi:RING-H2 finger protein ATL57, partial [Mucuna pruriens]
MSSDSAQSNERSQWKLEEVLSVIIVCLIFLTLSDCFGIFKRFLCGIWRGRSQVERQLVNDSIPEDPSLQLQSRGLDLLTVQSLPTFRFEKNEGEQDKATNMECAICLGEFEEGECLKQIPHCSHSFHSLKKPQFGFRVSLSLSLHNEASIVSHTA